MMAPPWRVIEAFLLGANCYIVKPNDTALFEQRLKRLFDELSDVQLPDRAALADVLERGIVN